MPSNVPSIGYAILVCICLSSCKLILIISWLVCSKFRRITLLGLHLHRTLWFCNGLGVLWGLSPLVTFFHCQRALLCPAMVGTGSSACYVVGDLNIASVDICICQVVHKLLKEYFLSMPLHVRKPLCVVVRALAHCFEQLDAISVRQHFSIIPAVQKISESLTLGLALCWPSVLYLISHFPLVVGNFATSPSLCCWELVLSIWK